MANPTTNIQKPPQKPVQARPATDIIQEQRQEFIRVIPKHLDPDRLIRVAISAINRDKNLQACTPYSILRSVMQAAALGLEIGVLGEGWLIPFKEEATFIPGYQGLIKLAIQSGAVSGLNVGCIYEGDEYEIDMGSEAKVRHKPRRTPPKDGEKPIWYYCSIRMANGFTQTTVMADWEIEKTKARSKGARSGMSPWNNADDYAQMGIKTVIRRAMKYVPKTPQLTRVLEYEQRRDDSEKPDMADIFPDLPPGALPGETVDVTPPKGTEQELAEDLSK